MAWRIGRQRILAAGLVALAAGASAAAVAPGDALRPGADVSDCRSALHAGPTNCPEAEPSSVRGATPDAADTAQATPSDGELGLEAQVDAYLASYGKPPREAVRALLDPSETNIRALVRKQEETLAVAAYVAERMTQLQREGKEADGPPKAIGPPDLPALMQMSVTLFQKLDDEQAAAARGALRVLARAVPALRARIALVGTPTSNELRAAVARVAAPLAAAAVRPQDCAADALPFVRIEDLRYRRVREIDAHDLTPDQLRSQIAGLRAESLRRGPQDASASPD